MNKAERKAREFSLRRAEILDQAVKIFAAKGFHRTTVAEIAEASGFAIGTLYQFFESKDQLYIEMLTEKLVLMYGRVQEAVAGESDGIRKIEVMIESQFAFIENNVDFYGLFVREDHLPPSGRALELRKRMMADYMDHIAFVEGVMREEIRRGILMEMDPQMMAVILKGIIRSCVVRWLSVRDGTSLASLVPFVAQIFLEGVRKHDRP